MAKRILGLSGSLRAKSFNTALLHEAARLAPEGVSIEIATLHGIPLYDGDEEAAHGLPEAVTRLKDGIDQADALLVATPEYNQSIPGVLKNGIDWLSRPAADIARVFGGKPVGVIGASPGRNGTILSQAAWLPVLRALGVRPFFGATLYVGGAGKAFDGEGRLEAETEKRLRAYLEGFARFVAGG
jgi:chromate reductase, NAD(P)H dehydrogenase (quinone)